MVNLALVQLAYLPAYFSNGRNHLSIDGFAERLDVDLTRCFAANTLREFKKQSQSRYEENLLAKIEQIIRVAHSARANLIVFPEYSIPASALHKCRNLSKELDCTIVAGSHRVAAEQEKLYASLGFTACPAPGLAVAPVFRPKATPLYFAKKTQSKWETDLDVATDMDCPERGLENGSEAISLLLCIDALNATNIGDEFNNGNRPKLLICPSFSPSVSPFENAGAFLTANDCLLAYANNSDAGGTFVYTAAGVIEKWGQPLLRSTALLPGQEGILRVDLDLSQISPGKGSIYAVPKSVAPWVIPIVHAQQGAAKLHEVLIKNCERNVGDGKLSKVADAISNILATRGGELDQQVYERLRATKELTLEVGSINKAKLIDAMRVCFIPEEFPSLAQLEANELGVLQQSLRDCILNQDADATEIGKAIGVIKHRLLELPSAKDPSGANNHSLLNSSGGTNRGIEWSIARFQNRGGDLDRFRQLVQNEEIGLIIIAGPSGIGKTDFVRAAVSKLFPGHRELPINIYSGMSVSQALAEVAVSLGFPYDVDALDALDKTALATAMREVAQAFLSRRDEFLIFDDLALIFRRGASSQDGERLKVFFDALTSRHPKRTSKAVVCWSGFLPDFIRSIPYSATIDLRILEDEFVRRIVERQLQLVKDRFKRDADLTVDPKVIPLLSGHPMSAVTLVEFARDKGSTEVLKSASAAQKALVKGLLPDLISNPDERNYLALLACIRRPISLAALRDLNEEGRRLAEFATSFADRAAVLLPEGDGVKLHEAIREEFLREVAINPSEKKRVHTYLASLYKSMIPNKYVKGRAVLVAKSEYVHHMVAAGLLDKTTGEARSLVTQIKRSARELYLRDRQYSVALGALDVAASIVPGDYEVQEARGRCCARLQQWDNSDAAFQLAIDAARRKKSSVAWILKNWGHIRARFNYYDRAESLFSEAEREGEGNKDASILSARAYMDWKRGKVSESEAGFREALDRDPYNEYTLIYFARLLRQLGKLSEADSLDRKRQELSDANLGRTDGLRSDIYDDEE